MRDYSRYPPSSGAPAWPCCEDCSRLFGKRATAAPKIKDPSGGTTGRVKAIWALGVDGRSRRIQPMGRDNRSHAHKSRTGRPTFKTPSDFFNLLEGRIYCAAGRFASSVTDFSDAMAAAGPASALLTESSLRSGAAAGLPGTAATGTAVALVAAHVSGHLSRDTA